MTTVCDPTASDTWRGTARTEGPIDFDLPSHLEATRPPEERGLGRDDVRVLVARRRGQHVEHHTLLELPDILDRGDVLVVNTSATLPASIDARTLDGRRAELHLSTRDPEGSPGHPDCRWIVELRHAPAGGPRVGTRPASTPWLDAAAGTILRLAGGGTARLLGPAADPGHLGAPTRLWIAGVYLPLPPLQYMARHGRPIRYGVIDRDRPIDDYQTIFAVHPGSAEMPSAARPFSPELVTRLVIRGILFAPLILHTGVASPEAHEPPTAEWYQVPRETAALVNLARRLGRRVIAVGTTAVRALESATDTRRCTRPLTGWTTLVITPTRPVRSVDGVITGWHEAHASHFAMLQAIAGRSLLEASYREALNAGYLWHEFGDSHLILV